MNWVLVMLGGAVGSALRHGVSVALAARYGTAWPAGTLAVNALGALAMGMLVGVTQGRGEAAATVHAFAGVGLLGGFTTYSAFNMQMVTMIEEGAWTRAVSYGGATVALCLPLGFLGVAFGRALAPGR